MRQSLFVGMMNHHTRRVFQLDQMNWDGKFLNGTTTNVVRAAGIRTMMVNYFC